MEAGAILDCVTAAAAEHGLRFGPDPSTHARATARRQPGNNACGSRALGYGRTADNVVDLDVLTATGVRFTARSYGRHGFPARDQPELPMLAALDGLVRDGLGHDPDRVRAVQPPGFGLPARTLASRATAST